MIQELTFDEKNFMIGGKPVYFNCGEFHYFRVPKQDWKRRMELLKAAGGNAVATYIPWSVHEPVEGTFLFDQGDGVTDLTDFLECAKEVGLYVIARTGPYSYSELVDHGLPRWLMETYPEILSVRKDGSHHGTANVSYVHPVFLEKARAYYRVVCPIVAKYTIRNGGTVAVVQLDNELTGIHVWFGGRDYNPAAMGFGVEGGRYPEFLKKKYGSVEAVNAAYGTDKTSFTDFSPSDEPASGPLKTRWELDYIAFYNGTISDYLELLMQYAEESGINCAFCHNAANPWMDVVFRDAKKRFGNKLLIGSDHYYTLCQTWQQNHPTPQFMIYCFMSAEMLRLMGNPPCIFETQYGSISEWPPTSAEDVEALLMCQLASGVRGHNGYVFTGGPNPPGQGTTCIVYDYDAPVGADGSCRPTYDAIRRFGAFVEAHPELATDRPDTDLRVAMPWRCFTGAGGKCHETRGMSLGNLASTFQLGMLSGFFAAGLQCEFIDPELDDWTDDISTPLFIPCDGVMNEAEQQRVADFIRRGGNVVFSPVIPFLDENFAPCTVISDTFGGASSGDAIPETTQQFGNWQEIGNIVGGGALFTSGIIPEGATILGKTYPDGKDCVGWHLQTETGSLAWYGVATALQRLAHIEMIRTMFEAAHGTARWRSDNPWIMTWRRRLKDGSVMVFLANLGTSKQSITPEIRKADGSWHSLPRVTLSQMEIRTYTFEKGFGA